MGKNPVRGILRRLAKWLVRKGMEELDKELEKQRASDGADASRSDASQPSR